MARRKLPPNVARQLIAAYDIKGMDDIKAMVRDLVGDTLQDMLSCELDEHLGYEKYDTRDKQTDNSRNGHSRKTLRSEYGEVEIDVPRDRKGEFEPIVVAKHQRDISEIEGQIISMYAKGMSNRDIEEHMRDLYGVNVSSTLVSRITDKVVPEIREWQSRMLRRVYAIVYMDAIHYSVRQEGTVVRKAVYIAIGIDLEGHKDVLGIWIGEIESAKFWLSLMNELKNRGVQDILIASVDGLSGFTDAIRAVFPKTEVQRCIIHQIRSSTRYVSSKDMTAFMAGLKAVYQALTEEAALAALDALETEWGKKYPSAVRSWRTNWVELSAYFKYPPQMRKIIYTTNAIESFNRSLRKVTKTKAAWVSEDALTKSLYLAIRDITAKWTGKVLGWSQVLNQIRIYFGERITEEDLAAG